MAFLLHKLQITTKSSQEVGLPMITITINLCLGSPARTAGGGRIVQTFEMVPMII